MGIIYCARNTVNNKLYIGKTMRSLEDRKSDHYRMARSREGIFHKALRKYGRENFSWAVLDEADSKEELNLLERLYIDLFSSSIKQCGYNLTAGGDGGAMPPEILKRNADALRGKPSGRKGIPFPEYAKEKVSNSLKAKYASGELKPPNLGKKMTPEQIQRWRAGLVKVDPKTRGRDWTPEERARHGALLTGRLCPRVKPTEAVCAVCGKSFQAKASRIKFCPSCKELYGWRKLAKLRTDGYVPRKLSIPFEVVAKGKFKIRCTVCGEPFICGTTTRKKCHVCS